MKAVMSRGVTVALIAVGFACQGCLVPWKKYITLKRKYEDTVRDLAAKESQLADASTRIDRLLEDIKLKDQLLALYAEKGKDADERVRKAREELDRVMTQLKQFQAGHPDSVELVDGRLIIKDELLFALGSDEVTDAGKKLLQDLANHFKGTNDILQIDGHTDDIRVAKPATVAKFRDNWGLAAMRARSVLTLLAQSGIPERRLYIRAFSMFRPRIPDAKTDAARAKNRRVEISVFPEAAAGRPAEPKPDAPRPETSTPEAPKPDAPKAETPAPEPAKPAETK